MKTRFWFTIMKAYFALHIMLCLIDHVWYRYIQFTCVYTYMCIHMYGVISIILQSAYVLQYSEKMFIQQSNQCSYHDTKLV